MGVSQHTKAEKLALGKRIFERDREKESTEDTAKRLGLAGHQAFAFQKLYKDSMGTGGSSEAAPAESDSGTNFDSLNIVERMEMLIEQHVKAGGGTAVVKADGYVCVLTPRK